VLSALFCGRTEYSNLWTYGGLLSGGVPGDVVLLEEGDSGGDGDGSTGDRGSLERWGGGIVSGVGERCGTDAEPTAFDEAKHRVGVLRKDRGAALA